MAELPKAWPPRCPQPLEDVQELLIDYLSSGQGYDDRSVAAAVAEGNDFFQQKDFSRACASFGIAYEIGRHHYVYRPLLHDLLLRRILCHSLLGNFDAALQEIEKANWLIPHQATAQVISGVVYSKLGMVTEANTAFQQAVAIQRDLKDFVDSMVAFFWLQHAHADRAIKICTQVLQRSPKCPFALLMRADAYKFGLPNSQANRRNAAADYADLLELDLGYQALIGRHVADPTNHTRADELLLSFHPTLQMQGPKAYHEYALCRRKEPFMVASLVVLAVCKLRLLSSSGRVLRKVQEAYEDLLEQRAELQRKVHFLLQSQRQQIASPLANQVYGPIDPENPHCRRYRRYWMEHTPRMPVQAEPKKDVGPPPPPSLRRQQALLLAQQDAEAEFPQPQHYPPATQLRASQERRPLSRPADSAVPDRQRPRAAFAPAPLPADSGEAVADTSPASCEDRGRQEDTAPPSVAAHPAVFFARGMDSDGMRKGNREAPMAVPVVEEILEPGESRGPEAFGVEPPPLPAMSKMSMTGEAGAAPAFRASQIQGWSEEQWLMKAQELLKTFGIDTRPPATSFAKEEFREVPPPPPPAAFSTGPGLKSNKLIQKLDEHGLEYLQDWYTPLDRVHKVRDMALCRATVEPPVAVSGLLGMPGHSYVVPRVQPMSRASSQERRRAPNRR